MKDYYALLGVLRDASEAEIKEGLQAACHEIPS